MSHKVDQAQPGLDPLMPLPGVRAVTGLGTTSVYKLVRTGQLAPQRKIKGTGRVGWRTSDVKRYLDGLPPVELRPMPGPGSAAA